VLQRLEFHYVPKHASWLKWSRSKSACCVNASIDASTAATRLEAEITAWEQTAKCLRRPHHLDVHHREGRHHNENGAVALAAKAVVGRCFQQLGRLMIAERPHCRRPRRQDRPRLPPCRPLIAAPPTIKMRPAQNSDFPFRFPESLQRSGTGTGKARRYPHPRPSNALKTGPSSCVIPLTKRIHLRLEQIEYLQLSEVRPRGRDAILLARAFPLPCAQSHPAPPPAPHPSPGTPNTARSN
jgi:hypothetical protein